MTFRQYINVVNMVIIFFILFINFSIAMKVFSPDIFYNIVDWINPSPAIYIYVKLLANQYIWYINSMLVVWVICFDFIPKLLYRIFVHDA